MTQDQVDELRERTIGEWVQDPKAVVSITAGELQDLFLMVQDYLNLTEVDETSIDSNDQ